VFSVIRFDLKSATSLLVITWLLCLSCLEVKAQAGSTPSHEENQLVVAIVQVVATNQNVLGMPEELQKTVVADGKVSFVVATDGKLSFDAGIPPELIIGFLADPRKGIVENNVIRNPIFMQLIWRIASEHRDDELYKTIIESEAKASILIDPRAKDPAGPIEQLVPDIIGAYILMENGEIVFEPNIYYRVLTEDGFIKLTPFIIEELFADYN
jgi:hypothetical protein